MKQIDVDNKIFSSQEFQKDKYEFFLITQNLKSDSVLLYSDEENYVICRGAVGFPTWIWTKDGISQDKVLEIQEAIKYYLTGSPIDKFTCKKELYDHLLENGFEYLNADDYFEMGSLFCKSLKEPKKADGMIDRAHQEEKPLLTEYWYKDSLEMNNIDPISMEQASEDVERMINSDTFYVWRNANGKIVCMVDYKVIDGQAKLSHVYTPDEERGKGYAANLIHDLTAILLSQGLVPLLYTDYNYPASNKAYINAGYEVMGVLINFSCSKERLQELK